MRSLFFAATITILAFAAAHCSGDASNDDRGECAARTALLKFVYANKDCAADGDCVFAPSCTQTQEWCNGGFFLSASYDKSQLESLSAAAGECAGQAGCGGCLLQPGHVCWRGTCWPKNTGQILEQLEKCIGLFARDSLCAECVCARQPGDTACVSEPSCRAILQCAHDHGCLGSSRCAPTKSNSPCSAAVADAGGPSSEAAKMFAEISNALRSSGCDVACSAP